MNPALFLGGVVLLASLATAQTIEKKYEPTEVQLLKLQVKQKDAQLAQMNLQQAQARFTQALNDLNAEGEHIKTENKWPAELKFSVDNLQFTMPPPPPVPAKKEK